MDRSPPSPGADPADIFAMAPDGSERVNLTSPDTHPNTEDLEPSLSPDGTRIAYTSALVGDPDPSRYDIWVMGSDGSTRVSLTRALPDSAELEATYSPDGRTIVFGVLAPGGFGEYQDIFSMGADGSNPTNLTPDQPPARGADFSPDGTQIVYSRVDGGDLDIYVMNADGSDPINLTNTDDQHERFPTFSPDGAQIAFESHKFSTSGDTLPDIFLIDRDGSNRRNVTNTPGTREVWPTFSPDGTMIAFSRTNAHPGVTGGPTEIVVAALDGSSTTSLGSGLTPDWGILNPPPAGMSCAGSQLTAIGTAVGEALPGTASADAIAGQAGADTLAGGGGGDDLCGGPGGDHLVGEADGPDIETFTGSAGRDVIRGAAGNDLLIGGAGRDVLVGGPGHDKCRGGPGRDRTKSC